MCLFLCLRTLLCCEYRYLLPNTCCCCCYLDCGCIFLGLVVLLLRIAICINFVLEVGNFDVIGKPNLAHISVMVVMVGCASTIFLLVGAICGCYQLVYVFVCMECLWYPGFLLWFYFLFNSDAGEDDIGWMLTVALYIFEDFILWGLSYVLIFLTVLEVYLLILSCSLYDALLCIYGNPDDYGPPYVVIAS
ncbi:uncharacterized protein LOC129000665 [Macrosteles quadrilineatus]|uniref:uncharacterized protein LOC129000665 n=1 Tax=Macrosteles quadrilineatus TaxID=74068 RepID=UPI0023E0CE81|nr:uncharacterized protein LOC129000665 [Macrosteles quadrilineatus]